MPFYDSLTNSGDNASNDDDGSVDPKVVKQYADEARKCLENGIGDASCDKAKALEAAALAAGIDPNVVSSARTCIDDPEGEGCAKAATKLAAISACTAATEGAGSTVCAQLAPFIVDMVWPLVGPVLTPIWGWSIGLAVDVLTGAFASLLNMVGIHLFGDDGPSLDDVYWQLRSVMDEQLHTAYFSSVDALVEARRATESELDVEPSISFTTSGGKTMNADFAMEEELEYWLRREPDWSNEVTIDHVQSWGRITIKFPEMPRDATNSFQSNWSPSHFEFIAATPVGVKKLMGEAASKGMAIRAQGLRNATVKATAAVIQKQSEKADPDVLEGLSEQAKLQTAQSEGSNTLLVMAVLAVAVGTGVWLWKRKAR